MEAKITKRLMDTLQPPESGQSFVWDTGIKGFGVRLTPNRKTYVVQARVKGKTVRVTLGAHGPLTPEQAREMAKAKLGEMAQGVNINQAQKAERLQNITLDEAFADYLKTRSLKPNTINDYHKAMRLGFDDWRNKPIRHISRDMVEQRFLELSKTSPAQANLRFRFLRALLGFAMEKYTAEDGAPLLPSNPVHRLTALKQWNRVDRRTRHIEPHQLAAWFKALERNPADTAHRNTVRDFCAVVLLTGCREQEIAQLAWADVDMKGRKITIPDTKNHRPHVLPVGTWLAALLARRREEFPASPFVFPAENAYGHVKYHRKDVVAISRQSGVEFRLHDLRRTFATIVNHHLERSLSPYSIKRLLNHSGGADVTAGYIQFSVEDLREPMQQVENYILKCAGLLDSAPVVEFKQTAKG
jgi:integrase